MVSVVASHVSSIVPIELIVHIVLILFFIFLKVATTMMQALNEHTLQVTASLATSPWFALLPELKGFLSSSLLVMVWYVQYDTKKPLILGCQT